MLSKNGRDFNQVVSSGYKTKSIAISETLSTVNLFFLLLGKRRSRQHLPEKINFNNSCILIFKT